MYETRPWLRFYGDIPRSLDYPRATMYGMLRISAAANPALVAYDFMGARATYRELLADIDRAAASLAARGLSRGDTITICLPNCPQAVILFYAVNKLGAVASMIHPLSAPTEIEFYLNESDSGWAATLDAFYPNFAQILGRTKVERVLVASIGDYMPVAARLGFAATSGRKIPKLPAGDDRILWWKDLLASEPAAPAAIGTRARPEATPDDCAVILYSGGTTGTPKGIMLSSMNFNCLGRQIGAQGPVEPRDVMLSILPMFHGFGLGVCIHTMLVNGGTCVLVPRFTSQIVAKLIKKKLPQYMAGVPTLFESLLRNKTMGRIGLACLKGAYAGGDKLPHGIKERFDRLIEERGGSAKLLEGYGLTESVTACIVTPRREDRPGSIGIPLPDMDAKIVRLGSIEETETGTDGELCVAGPTVMLGYLKSADVTARTLRRHGDGRLWLHTGDICSMDKDGFVFFKLRMKRIIKVSGVSVSPIHVEEVLDRHPDISMSCVIGIPDPHKMQALKAFIVLKNRSKASPEKEREIKEYCRQHLITWSVPKEIEFRDSLPMTRVGKVAFSELEKEIPGGERSC